MERLPARERRSWRQRSHARDVDSVVQGAAREGEPVPYSQWLRVSMMSFDRDVTMQDAKGQKYKWRANGPRGKLQLFTAEDSTDPIASYSQTRSDDGKKIGTLALDERAEDIRDEVVASFVFLEPGRRAQKRRAREHTASNLMF
ncbi:uncharacterized protein C8Q71DRAFT_297451 [Rhodofomes roseus]|uniref:DUF6593 domain-containing protein n=1 Tax=Rhodofomes roseus TaxID=34475 RepID=A0ABQ8K475_9APHY|nr:uncharacterized protein C8Q71DRAFT_297451 [Rhodofomes roseus]KAH9831665.1 hypothetical protein C8Q71DRAFT_297451 [Rhodofomes roseus]